MKKLFKRLSTGVFALSLLAGTMTVPAAAAETEKSGSFTAVSMNVDGLPNSILGISINSDGPGSDGTKAISQKMAEYGWDIIGVSEDFNYNTELMSSLTNYSSGTHRGGVSGLSNNTDGLNLIWKKSISVAGEKWTSWNTHYSTGIFGAGNGADGMIDKGYRYYAATIADSVTVDVYILHMDADSDPKDIAARESQLTQLATAIKSSKNGNPILVMGDTNCRYTRENLETLFIDVINADDRFTIQDTWVEKIHNGTYPTHGADAMVAKDKGGTYDYPEAEIVDKIFYINNTDSKVTLTANSHTVATDFTDSNGTALADHWPVVVEFGYTLAGETEPEVCEHDYQVTAETAATCTEDGSKTYTCSKCGDSYSEAVPALGHKYVDGVCSNCGAEESTTPPVCEHDYQVTEKAATCTEAGSKTYTCTKCGDSYTETIAALGHSYNNGVVTAPTCTAKGYTTYTCTRCSYSYQGNSTAALGHNFVNGICSRCGDKQQTDSGFSGTPVRTIESGSSYILTFHGTTGVFALNHSLAAQKPAYGNDALVWNVTEKDSGYTISADVNGQTMYLCRGRIFTGSGYRLALQSQPFVWNMRFNDTTNSMWFSTRASYGSTFYLRYYNARQGWIATTRGAGLKLYKVN